ncbi:MAG: site-2 protease family protein [Candidatus Micrarchaeia archaeon]
MQKDKIVENKNNAKFSSSTAISNKSKNKSKSTEFKSKNNNEKNAKIKPLIKSKSLRIFITFIIFILGIISIYFIYISSFLGVILQWGAALLLLIIIGIIIRALNGLQGGDGLYLLSTKKGLNIIDSISKKYREFWKRLPIWGAILGFGLLSYPLLKKRIGRYEYIFGVLSLIFILLFVLPETSSGLQFINLPQLQSASVSASVSQSSAVNPTSLIIPILSLAIGVIFGLSGYIMFLLVYLTAIDSIAFGSFLTTTLNTGVVKTQALQSIIPGIAPVIPGIDVPLFAGLIALIILLVIHEFSHGILSRIENIKLKSMGLLIFGIIPVGAFVEPDEKEISKLNSMKQTRIFAAGSAINLLASIIFFVIMLLMIYFIVPGLYSKGVFVISTISNTPAANVLKPNTQILYWNNVKIVNMSSFAVAASNDIPGKIISVVTNNGSYSFKAISIDNSTKGYIGVEVGNELKNNLSTQFWYFIYSIVVLSFIFNISIGIVNLLPLPFFDGWRIYKTNIKNKNIINILAAFVSIIFIINIMFLFISSAVV